MHGHGLARWGAREVGGWGRGGVTPRGKGEDTAAGTQQVPQAGASAPYNLQKRHPRTSHHHAVASEPRRTATSSMSLSLSQYAIHTAPLMTAIVDSWKTRRGVAKVECEKAGQAPVPMATSRGPVCTPTISPLPPPPHGVLVPSPRHRCRWPCPPRRTAPRPWPPCQTQSRTAGP
jgi:hypothetical protein